MNENESKGKNEVVRKNWNNEMYQRELLKVNGNNGNEIGIMK